MSKINLDNVLSYLEEKGGCEVHKNNNKIVILDLKKEGRVLYKKDLRLLNDLAQTYVQDMIEHYLSLFLTSF
jgi:hypothetical protein